MATVDVVDVSHAGQGNLPESFFASLAADGVKRVAIKAGGADAGLYKDAAHDASVGFARKHGLGVDHYFFNGPGTTAALAAAFVADVKGTFQTGDRLWLDIEPDGSLHAWPAATALAIAQAVKAELGTLPGVYLNESLLNGDNWAPNAAAGQGLWIAFYSTTATPALKYWDAYVYWQFTSTGHLAGYSGNLDEDTSGTGVPAAPSAPAAPATPAPAPSLSGTYTVKSGDTLSGIAAKYGTTVAALAAANGISNPNLIKVGQVLKLSGAAPAPAAASTYVVKAGDTLSGIAGEFHVAGGYQALAALNGIADPGEIKVGEVIKLPGAASAAPVAKPAARTYTVQKNDNLTTIAARFGVSVAALYAANKALIGPDENHIETGWHLTIP